MSVVASVEGSEEGSTGETFLYTKGAAERLRTICIPESVPSDLDERLAGYSRYGYRILGIAYRTFDHLPAGSQITDQMRA
jgi:cation-transporting ATPase 13A3/4/5